jgi:hypothetical protein
LAFADGPSTQDVALGFRVTTLRAEAHGSTAASMHEGTHLRNLFRARSQ